MNINEVKKLKLGDVIHFPEDRGDPAGSGKITGIGTNAAKSHLGHEYVWIEVLTANKKSLWPSNRLSATSVNHKRTHRL